MMVRYLKSFSFFSSILVLLFNPSMLFAESYADSIANALANIKNVSGTNAFVPNYPTRGNKAMITIEGSPAAENPDFGLTYKSNYGDGKDYLIVRTLTNSGYYCSSSTGALTNGTGDYTTFGKASASATWVTTGNDATNFINNNVSSAANLTTSMERGLGMSGAGTHTAVVEYGVLANNNKLIRPTNLLTIKSPYSTTNTDYTYHDSFTAVNPGAAVMDPEVFSNAQAYLRAWQTSALVNGTFPWTELGYTYYWGQSSTALNSIQGLSEFIILGTTAVKIIGIYSPQSYYYTKNSGQYGNGYANFNVTGGCDTVWAGNAFQSEASTNSASPNTITIASGATISGGQGILVWSPNYTVTNSGTISGATDNKLKDANVNPVRPGMSNTVNVALLFLGDTTYGSIAGGKNILTNSGTISSPGTAIEADAGNTDITNNGSGIIYGNNYAILTAAGDDTVTINGGELTGSIDLGTGTDTFEVAGTATLNFFLNRDTRTSAQLVNAETVTLADNKATLAVTAAVGTSNFRTNDSFLIVDAKTKLNADVAKISVENDPTLPMVTFSASKSGETLSLIATRDNTYYKNNSSNSSLGSALDSLADSASVDMSEIIGALDDSGNALNTKKLEPVAALPIVNTVIQTLSNFVNAFTSQMARLNNDDSEIEVYAVNGDKEMLLPNSAAHNLLAYNSNSILENSYDRPQNWEVFATGFGVMGFQSDHDNAVGYESGGGGTQFGFYRRANDEFMLGFLGGYMFNNVKLNQETGSQDINSVRIGPCGKWMRKDLYATGAVTYGYHGVKANRKINIGIINRQADADYSMHDISPLIETGYIFRPKKNLEIVPNISLQYDWMHSQSYNESGAGSADLSVDAFNSNSLISVLGVRFNGRIDLKNSVFLPEFNVGWQHEYLGRLGDVNASFSSESSGAFTTHANVFDRNAVRAGVAANFIYGKNHNALSFQYNAEVYDSASNHVFSVTSRNYF
ncbi:MAG: autotransporter domain-containing protein [Candidatus Omnitrophica bacterium]|nr:autotransporter domain-containing protein [Candidatus Omnitrophota bacterium]